MLERILKSDRPVVLLTGPAVSGKTSTALDLYRHFLDETGRPEAIILAPGYPAVAELKRRLLRSSDTGVVIAPAVMTFAALAGRILSEAGIPQRSVSPMRRHLILRQTIDELHEQEMLVGLGGIAGTPGIVVSVDHAISELKRAAVDPEEFSRVVPAGDRKNRDLAEIYRRYQQRLQQEQLFDVEGQMWLAREYLQTHPESRAGLGPVRALIADGFTDFTPTQLGILDQVSRRVERTLVTVPHADDRRLRMWHWTRRTLNNLRRTFGQRAEHLQTQASQESPLRELWDKLFDVDADGADLPAEVDLIAAAGMQAEVSETARRIKKLLVDGAPAGSIAVLVRSLGNYRGTIERIFAEHDIPVARGPGVLTESPLVRFILEVAGLGPAFEFSDVLRVIKSSYFRPQVLGEFDRKTVSVAEMLIRTGNVLEGREAYRRAAERFSAAVTDEEDDDARVDLGPIRPTPQQLTGAVNMLEALFALAGKAQSTRGLLGLLESLQMPAAAMQHDQPELIARDLRHLAAFRAALEDLDQSLPNLASLREALAMVQVPGSRGESAVDVLDVLDARPLRYEQVFLLGAGEGQFPRKLSEGSLLTEADRTAWRDKGILLDSRSDLSTREMLLFYLATTRCNRRLTVSYLESDASGRPGAPSPFLLSMLEPFGGIDNLPPEQMYRVRAGQFVPADSDTITSRREAFNAAVSGFVHGASDEQLLGWVGRDMRGPLRNAARGIYARHRRWSPGECDNYDGRIDDPSLLKSLEQRFGEDRVYSCSQLNKFSQCPWQFFAGYLLKLRPLAEPSRQLESVARGTFCHDVLYRVMASLGEKFGRPVRLSAIEVEDLVETLGAAVTAESEQIERRELPYPQMWTIQRDRMHRQLRDYLLAQRDEAKVPSDPLMFELAFGLREDPGDLSDPNSTSEPAVIETENGTFRLLGKIDRIDELCVDGVSGLYVIDYKTGRLPMKKDIEQGRSLQVPLYALAMRQILKRDTAGGAYHRVAAKNPNEVRTYQSFKINRSGPKVNDAFETEIDNLAALAAGNVRAMREGRFDVLPTADCPSWCPFRQICEYSPSRAERKTPPADRKEQN